MNSGVRRIRVMCDDPYATDTDSSDDESTRIGSKAPVRKRFTREIVLPAPTTALDFDGSCRDNDKCVQTHGKRKRVLTKIPNPESAAERTGGKNSGRKCPVGVRMRKWGTFGCEIRNPITKKRDWLGTFKTKEEAARVYDARKREFDLIVAGMQKNKHDSSYAIARQKSNSRCMKPVPVPVPSDESYSSTKPVSVCSDESYSCLPHRSPSSVLDPDTLALKNNRDSRDVMNAEEGLDSNFTGELDIPDLSFMDDHSFMQQDFDFALPLIDLMVPDCGKLHGDYEIDDKPCELPDYDFELEGLEELPDYNFKLEEFEDPSFDDFFSLSPEPESLIASCDKFCR